MKRLLLLLIILQVYIVLFGQTEQKYLVFTFDRRYYVEKQRGFMGSGDNIWIVPFDSCKTRLDENDMNPLFVTEDLLFDLEDTTLSEQGFGNFFVVEYPQTDSTAWLLYKNRTKIQERTIKYAHIKSRDVLTIYFVPIIAKCRTHPFGYYKNTVVTIDDTPTIWSDFWKEDKHLLRSLLCHDFSDFDYIVSLKERTKGKTEK